MRGASPAQAVERVHELIVKLEAYDSAVVFLDFTRSCLSKMRFTSGCEATTRPNVVTLHFLRWKAWLLRQRRIQFVALCRP